MPETNASSAASQLRNARIVWDRPGQASITVGGVEVADLVTGMHLRLGADSFPRLTLSLDLFSGEADGEVEVTLSPGAVKTLVALGWTPPKGGAVDA